MTHIGHSLIGDPEYGRRLAVIPRMVADVPAVADFKRQALHAHQLELIHPSTEETMIFDAPIPDDMDQLMDELRLVADHARRSEMENDR
jgi:23S rRNA pseudouridine1911/1915/1917 synthase